MADDFITQEFKLSVRVNGAVWSPDDTARTLTSTLIAAGWDEGAITVAPVPEPIECHAVIHHGPGHQSTSKCELSFPHEVHQSLDTGEILRWRGNEAFTTVFDESPED